MTASYNYTVQVGSLYAKSKLTEVITPIKGGLKE
jgi:hypothetical protein